MKVFKNTTLRGFRNEVIKLPVRKSGTDEVELVDAKFAELLTVILNNAPIQTQNDSIQGMRLATAIESANKTIEIEDAVHDWLKPIAEKVTPELFRINGNLVYAHICEGFEPPKLDEKDIKKVAEEVSKK